MTDNKKPDDHGGINPVVAAGVAGAVVGAGLAVAGTKLMENEDNQKKVKQVLNNVKDQAMNYVHDAQQAVEEKKDEVAEKLQAAGDAMHSDHSAEDSKKGSK